MHLTSSASASSVATIADADTVSAVTASFLRGAVPGPRQVLVTTLAGETRVKYVVAANTTGGPGVRRASRR